MATGERIVRNNREASEQFDTDLADRMDEPHATETGRRLFDLLVQAARTLADELSLRGDNDEAIVRTQARLRDWIIHARGMTHTHRRLYTNNKILVHCMVGAATLGEAIELYSAFAHHLWASDLRVELLRQADSLEVVFIEDRHGGVDGAIRALWPLAQLAHKLDFLVGGHVPGMTGEVHHPENPPGYLTSLMFRYPLRFEADKTLLRIPARQLQRAVVARAADISAHVGSYMRDSIAAGHDAAPVGPLVAEVVRNERLRDGRAALDLVTVAEKLGFTMDTLRRRLREEGRSFRDIKLRVLDDLAKEWLGGTAAPVEEIASRLGYSDGFTFRRAFRLRNGLSPTAFRRSWRLHSEEADDG